MVFTIVSLGISSVYAVGPGNVQITQDVNSSCNGTQQLCEDIFGLNDGPSAASALGSDSKGNLIAAFVCSQFANCNGGNSHKGFLAWSNDGGATWATCSASTDCPGGNSWTTNISTNTGSQCIHSAAIYVSGSTVDYAYSDNTVNGQANYYVDRFQITYSGNAITKILNGGPLTTVTTTGVSDTTPGFSCVQQIITSPAAAGEIIVAAIEPNSGPIYLFRTQVTTSAFKDLAGTASSITGANPGAYDSVNGCIGIQPSTNDLWFFQVDQAGPQTFHVAQFPYSAGNWGTSTTHNPISSNVGSPSLTLGASCASDSVDNILYFTWFKCNLSGGSVCAPGTPASGTTCNFQLWEATATSSGASPTQLASLTDTGACHATQVANFGEGGGDSLTFVNGQLWLTGVDDNLFAPGCTNPITGGNAACCPSEPSGTTTAACQQLFLAKYTISGNTWGAITQYAGNPFGVLGEAAFLQTSTGNYYLVYATCATVTGTNVSNGGYSGTANTNDGGCQVGNTGSLWSDPITGAAPIPAPPSTSTLYSTALQGEIISAGGLIVVAFMMSGSLLTRGSKKFGGMLSRNDDRQGTHNMKVLIFMAIAILVVAIIFAVSQAGGPC
jgi:hypothetical protein